MLTAVLLLVAVSGTGAVVLVLELRAWRRDHARQQMLAIFGSALPTVDADPRQLLVWFPIAATARRLFPETFRDLDRAAGGRFPFTRERVEAAHARCTTEWLAWERNHDFEYKLKASEMERELEASGVLGTAIGRARLAAVEREQLDRYQERYEKYITTAKGLAALEELEGGDGRATTSESGSPG